MDISAQINNCKQIISEPKGIDVIDMQQLYQTKMFDSLLLYLDEKEVNNKKVSNTNIGIGSHSIHYSYRSTKEFYKIGLNPTSSGISIYLFGKEDKKYLKSTFAYTIGKATLNSYCIKIKFLLDINIDVQNKAVGYCLEGEGEI